MGSRHPRSGWPWDEPAGSVLQAGGNPSDYSTNSTVVPVLDKLSQFLRVPVGKPYAAVRGGLVDLQGSGVPWMP
jgi:hypothetical protein